MKRFGGALFCLLLAIILGAVSLLTGSGVVNAIGNLWVTSNWVQVQARLGTIPFCEAFRDFAPTHIRT